MNLLVFIAIPLLTAILVLLPFKPSAVKWIAFGGSLVQVVLTIFLYLAFRKEREAAIRLKCCSSSSIAGFPICIFIFILALMASLLP